MKKIYKLENLDCANCAAKIEAAIKEIEGVSGASVSFMTQKLVIETEPEILDAVMAEVRKTMNKIEPDCEIVF